MVQVLVVDDDPLFREIARELLESEGHAVTVAENGLEAMHVPADPEPALAVVDMLMPERDGIETIADLRIRWPAVKVIAVSAGARNLEANLLLRAARALGADAAMEKPVAPMAFLALVRELLSPS
jgi:CheY-like chemotaxis protein